jgi:hypothetical protein
LLKTYPLRHDKGEEIEELLRAYNRVLNAAINLYLRMEGVPHQISWWDNKVLPSLVGGYFLTGAELKAPDELVRGLYDAVKPKLYYAYDRYADAYLPMPT